MIVVDESVEEELAFSKEDRDKLYARIPVKWRGHPVILPAQMFADLLECEKTDESR